MFHSDINWWEILHFQTIREDVAYKAFYQNICKIQLWKTPLVQPDFVERLLSDLEVETEIPVVTSVVQTNDVAKCWSSVDSWITCHKE